VNELYVKRSKVERPVCSEMVNLLLQHNIPAAAYHGGKLSCRVMQQAKLVFQELQEQLMQKKQSKKMYTKIETWRASTSRL
jgi:hypothetical protein